MVRIAIIAAILTTAATVQAQQPQWESTQTVGVVAGKATVLLLPPGPVSIVITMQEKGIRPSTTCLAIDLGNRFLGGQVVQNGNTCTISFVATAPAQPIRVGVQNDDFVKHTYTFRAYYQPTTTDNPY